MATSKEMNLALMLDKMAGDLADDLEWALALLDALKEHIPKSEDLALRYMLARSHLRARQAYKEACDKSRAA